jgi:hypothetical protein
MRARERAHECAWARARALAPVCARAACACGRARARVCVLDYFWTTCGPCVDHVWVIFGPCLGYVCLGHVLFGTCLVYIWAMFGSYFCHFRTMFGRCVGRIWIMLGPCSRHVVTMFGPCSGHVWAMFGPCLGHVWTMFGPQVGLRLLRHCAGFCKLVFSCRTTPATLHCAELEANDNDVRLRAIDWNYLIRSPVDAGVALFDSCRTRPPTRCATRPRCLRRLGNPDAKHVQGD